MEGKVEEEEMAARELLGLLEGMLLNSAVEAMVEMEDLVEMEVMVLVVQAEEKVDMFRLYYKNKIWTYLHSLVKFGLMVA